MIIDDGDTITPIINSSWNKRLRGIFRKQFCQFRQLIVAVYKQLTGSPHFRKLNVWYSSIYFPATSCGNGKQQSSSISGSRRRPHHTTHTYIHATRHTPHATQPTPYHPTTGKPASPPSFALSLPEFASIASRVAVRPIGAVIASRSTLPRRIWGLSDLHQRNPAGGGKEEKRVRLGKNNK